jgi:hypothetical protein
VTVLGAAPDVPIARTLFGAAVCRFGCELQLSIDLIQQVLRLLSVTLHVSFIGLLRRNDPLPGLLAQPLCGSEIRMACTRDIRFGPLSYGNPSNNEKKTEDDCENSSFNHG